MGRKNFDYFIDRGYLDGQLAELKAALIVHIDNRLDELMGQLQPPAAGKTPGTPREMQGTPGKGEPDTCMIWKMDMRKRCQELAKAYPNQYADINVILRIIYRKMDGQYGVCLAQEAKECRSRHDDKISTFDAVSENPKLRSLFTSIFENMVEECRIREEKEQAVAPPCWPVPVRRSFSRLLRPATITAYTAAPHTPPWDPE